MEAKFLQVLEGRICDAVVDLRCSSSTFLKCALIELNADQNEGIFVPAGCAHGLVTMEDNTLFAYAVTDRYQPELERGISWNDPVFNLKWPIKPQYFSEKDRNWSPFDPKTADLFT